MKFSLKLRDARQFTHWEHDIPSIHRRLQEKCPNIRVESLKRDALGITPKVFFKIDKGVKRYYH